MVLVAVFMLIFYVIINYGTQCYDLWTRLGYVMLCLVILFYVMSCYFMSCCSVMMCRILYSLAKSHYFEAFPFQWPTNPRVSLSVPASNLLRIMSAIDKCDLLQLENTTHVPLAYFTQIRFQYTLISRSFWSINTISNSILKSACHVENKNYAE